MRNLIAGLFALVALSVVAAAAFATEPNSVFLCNGQQIRCLVDSENLETITLYDLVAGSAVECPEGVFQDEGWVNGSEDEVTTITTIEPKTLCKKAATGLNTKEEPVTNACKKVEAVEAVDLPWNTLVVLEAGVAWDLLEERTIMPASLNKLVNPGYLILCEITGGTKQNDECQVKENGETPLLELQSLPGNATELPLVSSFFPAQPLVRSELADCSVGGKEAGLVLGEDLLEALVGGVQVSLEISNEP